MLYIMDAELIEGNYVLYQGDLSTNRLLLGKAWVHEPWETRVLRACNPGPENLKPEKGRMRPAKVRKPTYDIQESSPA
nr:hypothetical protein [Pseudomonas sp. BSw22131]